MILLGINGRKQPLPIPCLGKQWRKFARCNFWAVSGQRAGKSWAVACLDIITPCQGMGYHPQVGTSADSGNLPLCMHFDTAVLPATSQTLWSAFFQHTRPAREPLLKSKITIRVAGRRCHGPWLAAATSKVAIVHPSERALRQSRAGEGRSRRGAEQLLDDGT